MDNSKERSDELRKSWKQIVDLYITKKLSLRQVAQEIGCSHEYVRKVITNCDLPINPRYRHISKSQEVL